MRQGGKEELRASVLKTYLIRVRTEKGERAVQQLLAGAGIDPSAVDNETGWVSQVAAKRALLAVAALLGRDAIRNRGEWATHPEALGVLVRMLRTSQRPVDAYHYLAQNAREVTRVGGWSIEELPQSRSLGTLTESVKMTYRPRDENSDDSAERTAGEGEQILCDARAGELASLPRIWARLPDAIVTHDACVRDRRGRVHLRRSLDLAPLPPGRDLRLARGGRDLRGGRGGLGGRDRPRWSRGAPRGSPRGRDRLHVGPLPGRRSVARLRAQPHRRARARPRAAWRSRLDPRGAHRHRPRRQVPHRAEDWLRGHRRRVRGRST